MSRVLNPRAYKDSTLSSKPSSRRDVLVKQHGLNDRQAKALGHLIQHGKLTIQDFEALCPTVNRRSLQRDLKGMLDKKLIVEVGAGATDPNRHYVLAEL